MIRRVIEDRINSVLANKKAVAIMGASQVGKSTLAASVIPSDANILEINGNSTDVQTMFANIDESKMRILIGNKNFLFVDEAHIFNHSHRYTVIDKNCYTALQRIARYL